MKKVSPQHALDTAYKNLYQSDMKHVAKNLDALIKAKKFFAKTKKR